MRIIRRAAICSPLQGDSVDKKLAQGDVPPLLLKNEESDGPEFAFGFLKMYTFDQTMGGFDWVRVNVLCTGQGRWCASLYPVFSSLARVCLYTLE